MKEIPDVYIATPCLTGEPWAGYLKSVIETFMLLTNKGYRVEHDMMNGCSLIPLARNLMLQSFRDCGAKTLLFIDADLSWPAEAALRLVESPHDVIAGAYPVKDDDIRFPANWKAGSTRLLQSYGLQGGFLKISRRAIERMDEKFPDLKCHYDGKEMVALFDTMIVRGDPIDDQDPFKEGQWLGEDTAFTRRWQMCGGRAFIDPNINFEHYGHKAWPGNLLQWLSQNSRAAA